MFEFCEIEVAFFSQGHIIDRRRPVQLNQYLFEAYICFLEAPLTILRIAPVGISNWRYIATIFPPILRRNRYLRRLLAMQFKLDFEPLQQLKIILIFALSQLLNVDLAWDTGFVQALLQQLKIADEFVLCFGFEVYSV
jgi:hypothetical protein